ncbi:MULTISPECIES: hypothetical protein [unclassified Actinoplanes]|uniref:hypothetical protein n=1 Tax=unclassified Actinoplanes TaxID=2626549 RepID=UPI0012BA7412|nr:MULTISPECIES: hypothetical protein [unclassified Actinoplanes]
MILRGRWSVAGAAVVVVMAGVVVYEVRKPRGDDLPDTVRDGLAVAARDAIEGAATGDRLACAVRVIGADPPTATAAAQVRTAYVWSLCETVGARVQSGSSMPAAVHLTVPPTVETPGDGVAYGPDLERIFPARLRDAVLDVDGAALEPQVRQRIRERS